MMGRSTLCRLLRQYVPLRRMRSVALVAVAVTAALLVWYWFRRGPPPTSAIGCKNRLAEFLWPRSATRKIALEPLGTDTRQLELEYFGYMSSLTRQCSDQVHVGPEQDGGWDVCLEPAYEFQEPCLVYSFGIGNDFRFEKGIEKLLGCEVHAFDPSMNVHSHQYSKKGYFYNFGLDNINGYAVHGLWPMKRLGTIMQQLNHTKRDIDYLKMDIEFNEWTALHDIIQSGLTSQIRQMAVEFHTPEMDIHTQRYHKCTWSNHETLASMLKILYDLRNAGFSVYYSRINYRTQFKSIFSQMDQYCCYNLHLVNTKHPSNAWKPAPRHH